MKSLKTAALVLFTTSALVAIPLALRGPVLNLLARHSQGQLTTVPQEQILPLLSQAAAQGEPGILILAEALGSRRTAVAQSASQLLHEQLDRWETLDSASASRNLSALAAALAGRARRYDPAACHEAAQLATRILLSPLDARAVDRANVIASCDKVFRATEDAARVPAVAPQQNSAADRNPSRAVSTRTVPGQFTPPRNESSTRALASQQPSSPADPSLTGLPGGGLPVASASNSAIAAAGQPQRLAHATEARPLRPPKSRETRQRQSDATERVGEQASRVPPNMPLRLDSAAAYLMAPESPQPTATELGKTDIRELMRHYATGDASSAEAARAELSRRGFAAAHFELARQLFNPDPQVRKRLVRALPGLQSINPEPWLLELSRDSSPEIRLAAVSLIATTGDPILLNRIERIAREDPDPRVQSQAAQIAKLRAEEK